MHSIARQKMMVNISPYSREAACSPIFVKLDVQGEVADLIMYAEFLVNWSRGYRVLTPPKIAVFSSQAASPLQQCSINTNQHLLT